MERTRLDDGPLQSGATWKAVDRVAPFRVEFTYRLIELEPTKKVVFELSDPVNGWVEYLLEPIDGDGTLLNVRSETKPSGLLRLVGWLPDALSAYMMKKEYLRLDNILDNDQAGARD